MLSSNRKVAISDAPDQTGLGEVVVADALPAVEGVSVPNVSEELFVAFFSSITTPVGPSVLLQSMWRSSLLPTEPNARLRLEVMSLLFNLPLP